MDVEQEMYAMAQRVAVLEAKSTKAEQDINAIGAVAHERFKDAFEGDDGLESKVEKLEQSMFKAQIYIATLSGLVCFAAFALQYVLSLTGLSLSDFTLRVKPK